MSVTQDIYNQNNNQNKQTAVGFSPTAVLIITHLQYSLHTGIVQVNPDP